MTRRVIPIQKAFNSLMKNGRTYGKNSDTLTKLLGMCTRFRVGCALLLREDGSFELMKTLPTRKKL